MKPIYFKFLILLIGIFVSNAHLHAEDYPSGNTTEAENSDKSPQESIKTPYPEDNSKDMTPPKGETLTAAQREILEAAQARNQALKRRATIEFSRHPPKTSANLVMPKLPKFIKNIPSVRQKKSKEKKNLSPPKIKSKTRYNNNIETKKTLPLSNRKCHVVCGQYSNYIYATLISSIAQSSSVMSDEIIQNVTKFTGGQIKNKTQCTAEALTPHLSGKNELYSKNRFFPGMPRPRLFHRVCNKQCLSGKNGIIYKKSNPIIIELIKQYDFKHGEKEDKALAIIAASGNGGF